MSRRHKLHIGLALWAVFCATLLVVAGRSGRPLVAAVAVLLASFLLYFFLRVSLEKKWHMNRRQFVLKDQGWSFLFGDSLVLPPFAFVAALGWQHLDTTHYHWYNSWWWAALAFLIGSGISVWFRRTEVKHFTEDGEAPRLYAPTKEGHDKVSYFVLFGGLLYLGLPVIIEHVWPFWAQMIVLVLAWGALGARDGKTRPHPRNLHPAVDRVSLAVID